jgi:hypothetical protein
MTLAPWLANTCAMPRPIPLDPPVMMTVRFFMDVSMFNTPYID